jgi:3-dehydro-L-gulonate 2-dehydrogenase
MNRIGFSEMKATIEKAFLNAGMPKDKAEICARVHTESSRDGVYSHGLNRVERFVEYINKGWVDVHAEAKLEQKMGVIENYNGNMAPGVINGLFGMDRATQLAAENGLGLVSMKNSTHWMRGGSYGWYAAEKGFIGICWTNTESCMPAWGASSQGIGNNPFIMAVPREKGHIVLDMAMSQYSYGKLQHKRLKNETLPYPGGFDQQGNLTNEPGPIERTRRLLPMGYWKGSGFAMLLDIISSLLSGGLSTAGIDKVGKGSCGSCNHVFIAIDPLLINTQEFIDELLNDSLEHIKSSIPASEGEEVFYPGERSLRTRQENMKMGIPVDDEIWDIVKKLASE